MSKGLVRAIAGASINMLFLRHLRHKNGSNGTPEHYHVVLSHPDDELAIYKLLRNMVEHPNITASFTLVTNGTQGYDVSDASDAGRKEYGQLRVAELHKSLAAIGFLAKPQPVIDERELYEHLVNGFGQKIEEQFLQIEKSILESILQHNPKAVFVNDFAGGHIVHDISNYLTVQAAKAAGVKTPVVEYWQPFMHVIKLLEPQEVEKQVTDLVENNIRAKDIEIVVGDLGYDNKGRKLRGRDYERKYTVEIPSLGIRKGRMFLSVPDILAAVKHKNSVYTSQEASLKRMNRLMRIAHGMDAPLFREIDLDTISHYLRPTHGVMYEACVWRKRGLARLPTFDDYTKAIRTHDTEKFMTAHRNQLV